MIEAEELSKFSRGPSGFVIQAEKIRGEKKLDE